MGRRVRGQIRRRERMGGKRKRAPFKRFAWVMRKVFLRDALEMRLSTLESPLYALLMPIADSVCHADDYVFLGDSQG